MEKGTVVLDIEEYNRMMGILNTIKKAEGSVIFIDNRVKSYSEKVASNYFSLPDIPQITGGIEAVNRFKEEVDTAYKKYEEVTKKVIELHMENTKTRDLEVKIIDLEDELRFYKTPKMEAKKEVTPKKKWWQFWKY